MSDSELDPAFVKTQLERLERRAEELEAEVATKQQRQPSSDPHELIDQPERATTQARAEVRSAEIERDVAELRDIALARERMQTGSYGECIDCGRPIGRGRLQAQPTALRCLACQEKFEAA